jgi:phosphate starvation-inducible protein PhoH
LLEDLQLQGKKSYEKEIPELYMNSGTEQKMELLRGLLDTDGTVEKTASGQVSFSTSSEKLVQQVQEIVWSIGGLCTITEKYPTYTHNGEKRNGRISYRAWIKIKNNKELFKLKRKQDLCRSTYDPLQYRRKIKEINYVGREEAKCIMIEDNNHLYITDNYTITHNTFVLLYKALKEVLDERTPYEKIYIVRSLVQTREIGFLPGKEEDKKSLFEIPYKNMVKYMFQLPSDDDFEMLYGNLKAQETISFWCTSFIRGVTLDNCIIIVDEAQNCSGHECFSVISRCGMDTKIMFAGDVEQSDLVKMSEKNGIIDFLKIIDAMPSFEKIEFGVEDIIRSPLVKEFVIAKHSLNL